MCKNRGNNSDLWRALIFNPFVKAGLSLFCKFNLELSVTLSSLGLTVYLGHIIIYYDHQQTFIIIEEKKINH